MNTQDFLKAIPKVSLHLHLMGSIQARTVVDLAKKHGVKLPDYQEPEDLYQYPDIYKFLHMYDNSALAIQDREDFARIAYETLKEAAEHSVRYREMSFNPTTHMAAGPTYATCVDGLIDGINAARKDFGIECRLIAAVNRMETPELAVSMVETMLANPRDEVIDELWGVTRLDHAPRHDGAWSRATLEVCLAMLAGEARDPRRDLSRAVLTAMAIGAVLYSLLQLVMIRHFQILVLQSM